MKQRTGTVRVMHLIAPLAVGLGLACGLLWAVTLRSTAAAQAASPDLAARPAVAAAQEQSASGEAIAAAQPAAEALPAVAPTPVPPRDEGRPPEFTLPYDMRAQSRPWVAGGAPFLAPGGPAPSPLGMADLRSTDGSGERGLMLTPPLPGSTDLAVCMTTDRVWGIVGAGEMVTVSVNGAQMGADEADQIGFFWTTLYDASGNRPGLASGDVVTIYHDGVEAGVTLRDINGQVDVVNDVVSGTISGSPISVTVYAPSGEPSMTSYSRTVSTDSSGNFSAGFAGIWDFAAWDEAAVAYVDGGVEVHRHVYLGESLLALLSPWNAVMGYAEPDTTVTVTLYYSDSTEKDGDALTAGESDGWYYWDTPTDFEVSDYVLVQFESGTTLSRTIDLLAIDSVDTANDRVTGEAVSGVTVRSQVGDLTPLGWHDVQSSTVATGGAYAIDFSGLADIMPGQWAGVYIADAEGDDLAVWGPSPSVEVNQTYNQVYGYDDTPSGPVEGRVVTLTFYSAISDTTSFYTTTMPGGWNQYWFDQKSGLPDIAPGDVVTVEGEGSAWQGVVQVMTMTVEANQEANQFTGTVVSPTGRVELSGNYYQPQLYPAASQFAMLVTASSPFTASPPGLDVNGDLYYDVAHRTAGDYVERISHNTDGFGEVINYNGVGGTFSPPGVAYTVTLHNSSGDVKTQATGNSGEPTGGFWINLWDYGKEQIEVGDYLQGQSAAGFSHTVEIPVLSITGDPDTDIVSGQGPANAQVRVEVGGGSPPPYQGYVSTDENGQFAVAVGQLQEARDSDLQWGDGLSLIYYDERNTWLVTGFSWPQLFVTRNMEGASYLFGYNAIPGNTIYVTVTDSGADVVATGTTAMGTCDWCDYWLDLPAGTIVPSNTVTVDWGDGYVDSVHVVTITGQADVVSDIVTGTAPAEGWLSAWAEHLWGDKIDLDDVQVDASGVYTLDLTGWGIEYGDHFYVYYHAPHGHRVEYNFWLPAPEVGVQKNTVGGFARPGGKYVYSIIYWNDGNGVATDTLLVDTLPMSTTYAGDTSGFPHIEANGVITWDLGHLPARSDAGDNWGVFAITLDVSDTVLSGTVIAENCITITTSAPGDYNPGNESSCTGPVDVWDSDVGVNIDKWPIFGDPTPGQEFEYHFRWCTDRGANFGPVWLTDTLPVSTTLLSWWTDWPWNLWTEVITTGGQFALYAPGLPGDYCQQTYLRLLLDPDAPLGTVLQNTIVITTPGDVDPGNNQEVNTDARVGPPRYDMRADKNFSSGVLVPGGWVNYHISYWNQGNSAVHAWLTDTLPTGTSYRDGSARYESGSPAFPPILVTDEYVVWDLGVIEVNQGLGLGFEVDTSDTVTAGTVITNCASVGITVTEDTPWDNSDCVTETINASGPNLRVIKESWWNGDNQLGYSIGFYNVGNQTINDVWITDTLPLSTTWDGWWNLKFDGSRLISQSLGSDVLLWELSPLYAGDSGGIEFRANLDAPNDRPRWYTNTVEIDVPASDTVPADNADTLVDVKGEVERAEMWIANEGANMWGRAQSNAPLTVTTALAQYTGSVNEWGDWNIDSVEALDPGATITVTAGAGLLPIIITIPDPFSAAASSITDTVWGQIGGAANEIVEVNGYWSGGTKQVPTNGAGDYVAPYQDVPRGAEGHIRYDTEANYAQVVMHRRFQTPDLLLRVIYPNSGVHGFYETGHTVWLTLTESSGITVEATAAVSTTALPWGIGFQTEPDDWSPPGQPEILPYDRVYGLLDNGNAASVQIGAISGYVDVANDRITGTIYAPWFTQTLFVECHSWGLPGPEIIKYDSVLPDGVDVYSCSWDPGEWDIEPGQDVGVAYVGSDDNWVATAFREPAPDVSVDKSGYGQPAPGGNYAYRINYHNHGDAAASSVVITDTLPTGMTYVTDTSGFPYTLDGNSVIWNLGSVDEYVSSFFDVFVSVASGLTHGTRVTNTVEIATPDYDTDPGNNYNEWWTEVITDEVHLNVGKGAWTGDPAAGTDVVFDLSPCNNSPAGSSWFTLTDTLHPALTLKTWWSQHPGWTEVLSDSHTLVLSRPTIPGWSEQSCSHVYLQAHVDEDAWQGMSISNTVVITASNDVESGDNESTWWGNVNNPHTNLYISKNWNWGQLTPGGFLRYNVNYSNNGNVPVGTFRITDTLPASTTFREALEFGGGPQVVPVFTGTEYVVWEISGLDNGYGDGFEVVLDIDPGASPGTLLTNTVEIEPQPDEDSYLDNVATVVETLYGHGPNLRVRKWSWWNGSGQLGYQIQFENVGDDPVSDVWITDTLPVSTTWDGWWNMGFDWSRLDGGIQSGGGQLWWNFTELYPGDSGWLQFNANLDEPDVRLRWFTNTVEIAPSDAYPADNTAADVAFSGGEVDWVDVQVGQNHIWSCAPGGGGPMTVTTIYTEVVFGGDCFDWWPADPFQPGDVVTVTAGAGVQPVVIIIPDPFSADANSATDTVSGQIDDLDHESVEVQPDNRPVPRTVQTDGSGNYSAVFPDIPRGGQGEVRYRATIDYAGVTFHRRFQSPDLVLRINYRDDSVDGNYEAGHTVWITVTSDGGALKGTAVLTTGVTPWGWTGFATYWQGWTLQPDIVPTDWVSGVLDNGYATTVHVGTITGNVDAANDRITGTIAADWFTETLEVRCDPWGISAPGKQSTAGPDGDPPYSCQWNPATEWDVLPGQEIGVWYSGSDRNQVGNVFHEPAADLSVDKYGQGQPAPGGNYAYRVNYHNYGDKAASGVVITDTLPAGIAYITDTSGFPYTLDGNAVIWDVGSLAASIHNYFDVFVSVDSGITPGTRVTNSVDIATPDYDANTGNDYNEWWTEVITNDTHLNVGKGAWTGDPAPGTEFVYNINVCSNGSTASSQVTLTDTLHLSTTLQYWWARETGWTEVISNSNLLVLSRPTIPNGQCDEVYLRVHLDESAWAGMSISNTAVMTASNDLEDNDNETTWQGNANNPHANLNINKNWNWGQLVPGGQIRYNINFSNNGNVPVTSTIRITDTFPVSTTFNTWNFGGWSGVTLTEVTAGYVVWELSGLDNGYGDGFEVVLDVDDDALPGTVLTNTAEISPQPVEDNYDDNTSTVVETLFNHGPNLRVTKWGGWHGDREGHAWYQFAVENVGDVAVSQVVVTDTYPLSMTLEGGVSTDWSRVAGYTHDAAGHWFTATLENVHPGYRLDFSFNTTMSTPVPFGLVFTNTVTVPHVSGDTNAADDSDDFVLSAGPDLYVEKTLADGTFLPGEVITFSLRYGNDQPGHTWWWNTQGNIWITDTLPAELEYITSTLRWCGGPDCPYIVPAIVGNQLVFGVGQQNSGGWNEIYLTVRITDTATGLDTFTNQVEIASDQPISDTEPCYDNNSDWYDVLVVLPKFEVGKVYAGNRVAGTVVTYTVTVTNTGNDTGSAVVLSDALPLNLFYGGSDGTRVGSAVTWTFDELEPDDTASGWFSGTLPCTTGGVINHDYRVVTSAQGVASPPGTPVTLIVIAPSINASVARDPGTVVVSQTVHFTATVGTNGTPLASYQWAFGDGTTDGGLLTASHVYTHHGVYTAVFTATDGCGYTDVATATVTVNPPTLVADFEQSATLVTAGDTVVFTDTSTTNVPPIVAWWWTFGDGGTSSTRHPTHAYTTVGFYTVTLLITDSLGYTDVHTVAHAVTVTLPAFQVGKGYAGNRVAGTAVTYMLTVTNTGSVPGSNVVLSDTLPTGLTYGGSNGTKSGNAVTWTFGSIAPNGGTASGWFSGTLPCTIGSVTNADYRVVTSTQGVASPPGTPVILTVITPTITAGVAHTPGPIVAGQTVYVTATVGTNGTPLASYQWAFGDGSTGAGLTASHAYTQHGSYTVVFTATDTCGYKSVATTTVTVNRPNLAANFTYSPSPAYILAGTTVVFTDTSTTDGPPIGQWEWDFGDGSAHAFTQNASHPYATVGTYAVTLVVTDALGYSDGEVKAGLAVVSPRCTALTSASFTYAPPAPVIRSPVFFTATYAPIAATQPITYAWDFGDGQTATGTSAAVQHTYTVSGTLTARVTAYNPCTPAGVTHQESITVAPLRVFLPLVLRNHH